ncbi:MFS transporter [Metallosphaera sedula]|nr:MFS transporter [Metallosphaera sedula]
MPTAYVKGTTILFSRTVYAISWFYLAPEIPRILEEFHESSSISGVIPLSFFLGSGIMQIPSAYLGTKIGQRNSLVLGLLIMSASAFSVAFSNSFTLILLSYFLGGVGASMFFSSGGAILSDLNRERLGFSLGLYNALFCVGGFLGLNWALIYNVVGFTLGAVLVGGLTFVSALLNLRLPNPRPSWRAIRNRKVIILGVATAGMWGVYYAVGELLPSFMVFYEHQRVLTSSAVTSLLLVFSALGGVMGWLGDRMSKMRLMIVSAVITSLSPLLIYTPLYLLALVILGIFNELAFSLLYSVTALEGGIRNSSITLAVVNSLNISLGTWLEFLSGYLGFYAWVVISIIGIVPLLLLMGLRTRT